MATLLKSKKVNLLSGLYFQRCLVFDSLCSNEERFDAYIKVQNKMVTIKPLKLVVCMDASMVTDTGFYTRRNG